jgi:hypothetical protein
VLQTPVPLHATLFAKRISLATSYVRLSLSVSSGIDVSGADVP